VAPILNPRLLAVLARRFNCDLVLTTPAFTPDGAGGQTRVWVGWKSGLVVTTIADEVLGAVEALTGEEKLQEGAVNEAVTHRILFGFQAGVKPTMQVVYGTRLFYVHTVVDYSEQHLLLELMTEEKFTG
jgi:SPP1 family predicted phage head-tail adaptor